MNFATTVLSICSCAKFLPMENGKKYKTTLGRAFIFRPAEKIEKSSKDFCRYRNFRFLLSLEEMVVIRNEDVDYC